VNRIPVSASHVDVRHGNPAPVVVVPVHVTITQIVGVENNDVGAACRSRRLSHAATVARKHIGIKSCTI
jgi:hypothetical protein